MATRIRTFLNPQLFLPRYGFRSHVSGISLRASSPIRSGGGAGKWKESLQLRLRKLNSTSKSPVAPSRLSCQISANQRERKQKEKTRAKGNDVITNVISANQHFALTFSMQIFQFQIGSCKLSFLFPPRRQLERPGELSQANPA